MDVRIPGPSLGNSASASRVRLATSAIVFCCAAALSSPAAAACVNTAIGTVNRTYIDRARNDRNVTVRIDYPAQAAGSGTEPIRGCAFPSIAFGHGFTIAADAYQWLRDAVTPAGMVLLRPGTESGLSPNHLEFARDLNFVQSEIRGDPFFSDVLGPARVLGGHSMGGGAALLAAAERAPTALFGLAPAQTNPSAIAAASLIQAPVLLLTGSRDCVTPLAQHVTPMLAALASTDRQHVDISGGSHCQFSDGSITCSIGENSCGGSASISAAIQQQLAREQLVPWLALRVNPVLFGNGFEP